METNRPEKDGFSKVEADAMLHVLRDLAHDGRTISEDVHLRVCALVANRPAAPRPECAQAGRHGRAGK